MSELAALSPIMPTDLYIAELSGADLDLLRTMIDKWSTKISRHLLRRTYYDGKNRLRDLGISLPPQLKKVETVVGWPAKAVDALAHRIVFDGFVLPGDEEDPYGLTGVFADNDQRVELPQTITASLIHSVSFMSVTQGDLEEGDPEILVQARSGMYATGVWDRRRRALRAALLIIDVAEDGTPTELVMHLPDRIGHLIKRPSGRWTAAWRRNPVGRVLVEPLKFRPDLDRPLGRSRISRPVMAITDEAVRTVLRTEVSAEFYAAPARAILGADEDPFVDDQGRPIPEWQAIIGRIWAISRDEEGNVPTLHEFRQMTMQPHLDHLREIASRFAAESSLPLSSLGIVQDNPASAEAIYAAKEDLVIEAQDAAITFGASLVRTGQNIVQLRDGLDRVPDDLRTLQAKFANPATPSVVSAADAVVKQVAAVPWLAESSLILERMGYTQAEITRLMADKRRAEGNNMLTSLMARVPVAPVARDQQQAALPENDLEGNPDNEPANARVAE